MLWDIFFVKGKLISQFCFVTVFSSLKKYKMRKLSQREFFYFIYLYVYFRIFCACFICIKIKVCDLLDKIDKNIFSSF